MSKLDCIEIKDYKRKSLYEFFDSLDNPFIFITTKIDITNLVKFCKIHKNFYATFGYYIAKANNQVEEFKVRFENGKFYKYEQIDPSFADSLDNDTIGFFRVKMQNDYNDYIKEFSRVRNQFKKDKYNILNNDSGEIWMSSIPWFNFSSLVPTYGKNKSNAQFIWDKYLEENGRYTINLMISIHHGLADGRHISEFIDKLKVEIENLKG